MQYQCHQLSFSFPLKKYINVQVSEKKAREWCASRGDIPYFETSAKEGYNVHEAFLCVAKMALEGEHEQEHEQEHDM